MSFTYPSKDKPTIVDVSLTVSQASDGEVSAASIAGYAKLQQLTELLCSGAILLQVQTFSELPSCPVFFLRGR